MFMFARLNTYIKYGECVYAQWHNGALEYSDYHIFWRNKIDKGGLYEEDGKTVNVIAVVAAYERLKYVNDQNNTKKDKYGYDELRMIDKHIKYNQTTIYHPVTNEKCIFQGTSELDLTRVRPYPSIKEEKEYYDMASEPNKRDAHPCMFIHDYKDLMYMPYNAWPVHFGYVSRGMDHEEFLSVKDKYKWAAKHTEAVYENF